MSDNKDERIKVAIDGIEPVEGAKERMFANIMKKAAETEQTESSPEKKMEEKKITSINKIMKWAMPLAACLALALVGGFVVPKLVNRSNNVIGGNNVQIANPFVEVESAEAFKKDLGIEIDAPEAAENVTYNIIMGQTADIKFDLNGHNYVLRASKETDIIMGLYGSEEKVEDLDLKKGAELTVIKSGEESYLLISWKEGKTNFALGNTDGASQEEIKEVFEALR